MCFRYHVFHVEKFVSKVVYANASRLLDINFNSDNFRQNLTASNQILARNSRECRKVAGANNARFRVFRHIRCLPHNASNVIFRLGNPHDSTGLVDHTDVTQSTLTVADSHCRQTLSLTTSPAWSRRPGGPPIIIRPMSPGPGQNLSRPSHAIANKKQTDFC